MASYLNLKKKKTITLSKICLAATWKTNQYPSNQIKFFCRCVCCVSLPFYLSLSLSSFAHANLNKYPKQNITVLWWWIPCCVDVYSPDRHEVFKNDSLSHKRSCTFFCFLFIFYFSLLLSFFYFDYTLVFSVLFFFLLVKIRNLPTHQVTRTAWIYGKITPLSNCMLLHSDY